MRSVIIPGEFFLEIKSVLENHMFSETDDSRNNNDVCSLLDRLERVHPVDVPDMKCLAHIGKGNGPRGAEGTSEPIWLFQIERTWYPEVIRDYCENNIDEDEVTEEMFELAENDGNTFTYWHTDSVFLSREEGEKYGKSREYEWGKGKWRVFCISLWRTFETKHILSAIDTVNLEAKRK